MCYLPTLIRDEEIKFTDQFHSISPLRYVYANGNGNDKRRENNTILRERIVDLNTVHAVVSCEIKLFPNYFSLRRRPSI